MRHLPVLFLALIVLSLPSAAQEATGKTKAAPPSPRTYLDTIDVSSGAAVVRGFVEAYASDDFYKAYLLLSPNAKSSFVNKVFEYNEAALFPGIQAGRSIVSGTSNELPAEDVLKEIYLDGALMFDTAMQSVHRLGLAPFDFAPGAFISATFEHEDQARYLVGAAGTPDVVVISAIRMSNGQWRVERLVWASSDPDATPWGFK